MKPTSAEDPDGSADLRRAVRTDSSVATSQAAIRLFNVRQTYGGCAGVEIDVLNIRRGGTTAIMGRSGSGKSTLLNLIGGMVGAERTSDKTIMQATIRDEAGQLKTQDILKHGWRGHSDAIGFVFQHPFMLRHATGVENLAMSLAAAGRRTNFADIDDFWTNQLLMSLDKASVPARDLSGGMQQRLAVGRALIRDPQIIFADEPTANLDPTIGNEIIERIWSWQRAGGNDRTVILVTHDVAKAARFADDLIVLDPQVVGSTGSQTAPGRLLGASTDWPRPNPKVESVISAWMQGDPNAGLSTKTSPTAANSVNSASPAQIKVGGLSDRRARPASPAGANAGTTPRDAGVAPWRIWVRLGVASLFSKAIAKRDPRTKSDSMLGIVRSRVTAALSFVLPFAPLVLAACLWIFGNDIVRLLGMALTPLVAPVVLERLLPKIAWTAVLRVIMLTILTTLAIAADKAQGIITTMMEAQLNRPDLKPLIALRGKEPLTTRTLDDLQRIFEDEAVVDRAKGPNDRSVFGRVSVGEARIMLPANQSADAVPACPSGDPGNAMVRTAPVLGIDRDEPFISNLEWISVAPNQPMNSSANWLQGTRQGSPPSLEAESQTSNVYLLDTYLRNDLKVGDGQNVPRWVCMSGTVGYDFVPYRVAALIKYVPLIDKRQHAIIASCDTAAQFRGEIPCMDVDFKFDQVAIEVAADARRVKHLELIKRLSDRGMISAETGFQKVQEGLKAASFAAGVASWFIVLTGILAASVTFFSVMQFIEENRRPLAVARAFGATFFSLAILLGINLLVPLGLALCAGLFFSAITLPSALDLAFKVFDLGISADRTAMASFLTVAGYGVTIVTLVFLGVLFRWWWKSGALAGELQEVG